MYTADFHVHSRFSPDGREPVEALAAAAAERGLDEICVTDHVDVAEGGRTAPLGWAERLAEYRAAACRWDGKVRLRLGVELGDMVLDFPAAEEILRQMPELDFVIGSLHAMSPAFGRRDLCFVDRDDLGRLDPGDSCGCGISSPCLTILGRVGAGDIKTCAAGAAELLGGGEWP